MRVPPLQFVKTLIMKQFLGLFLFVLLLVACKETGKNVEPAKAVTTSMNPDSVAIAATLHTFYQWYAETGDQLITKFNFINTKGKHPSLDEAMLQAYFAEFLKTGVVSSALIEDETKFYRACAEQWKTQTMNDGIAGFAIDRYYCQNDVDAAEFQKAGVKFKIHGDRAKVLLLLAEKGPNQGAREFEMKQENGKWLLSRLRCNSGVTY